jgi:hypothetical protein
MNEAAVLTDSAAEGAIIILGVVNHRLSAIYLNI